MAARYAGGCSAWPKAKAESTIENIWRVVIMIVKTTCSGRGLGLEMGL